MKFQSSSQPERYVLEGQIGAGGMGRVFEARDRATNTTVAIKLLHDTIAGASGASQRERFHREADMLAELEHPGIVSLLGHGFSLDGGAYLVMEWIDGESLDAYLERSLLSDDELVALLREIAAALAVAHRRGIIHRDLKPSNIMLRDGRLDQVVLIDFGIARRRGEHSPITRTGALVGTPEYMAPEQARGVRELSASADVFALGCIAFRCLLGRSPFAAEQVAAVLTKILFDDIPKLRDLRPQTSKPLGALIERMLSRDLDVRPSDADALYGELLALGSDSYDELSTLDRDKRKLTVIERRLVSVLAISMSLPDLDGADAANEADPGIRETLADGSVIHDHESLALAVKLGGQPAHLGDDRVAITFSRGTSATDRATVAARCALALRQRWPSWRLALCTDHGQAQPGADASDPAFALLVAGSPGVIVIDELTAELLDERFDIAKHEGVQRLSGESPHDRAPRQLLGKPMPCLGRAHELGILDLTFEACVEDGRSHFVLVSGEPGCGKSRLRHEFLRRHSKAGQELTIVHGEGNPMTAGSPFAGIGDALCRAAGVDAADDTGARQTKLDALIARWLPGEAHSSAAQFLARVVGLDHTDPPSAAFRAALRDPALMRERCTQTCVALLAGALARQPVLLVIDDLHWGDQLTVELLARAHQQLADRPLMIICLTRPEALERFSTLASLERGPNYQQVRLGGLSRRACARLIRLALAGVAEPSDTLVERLTEHADGNALVLEELIRATASSDSGQVPTTVNAMLQARMERLDELARHALLAASVYGLDFDAEGVLAMLDDVNLETLRPVIQRLIGAEMIEISASGGYRFRHAMLRDAAYLMLSPEGARRTHLAAAEHFIGHSSANSMVIAEHLSRAGRGERAARYYLDAAEQASATDAIATARRRAELGLACGPAPEVAGLLTAILAWAHGFLSEWDAGVSKAEQIVPELAAGSYWWCRCISVLMAVGLLRDDERMLQRWANAFLAAEVSAETLVPYLDAANVVIGSATTIGRYRLSDRFRRRVAEVARAFELDSDARRLLAFCEAVVGFHVDLDPSASLAAATVAVDLSQEVNDGRYTVFSRFCASFCHERLGEHELAIDLARRAMAEAEVLANPYLYTYATVVLAAVLVTNAPTPEALEEAISLATQIIEDPASPPPYPGWAQTVRARARLLGGEAREAVAEATTALRLLAGAPSLQCRAWLVLADAHQARARVDAACEAAEAALDVIEREAGWEYFDALLACARLRRAAGDEPGAASCVEELRELRAKILSGIREPEALARAAAALAMGT